MTLLIVPKFIDPFSALTKAFPALAPISSLSLVEPEFPHLPG